MLFRQENDPTATFTQFSDKGIVADRVTGLFASFCGQRTKDRLFQKTAGLIVKLEQTAETFTQSRIILTHLIKSRLTFFAIKRNQLGKKNFIRFCIHPSILTL